MLDAEADLSRLQLREIIQRLEEPRPALVMLGGLLEEYEAEVFATGGHGTWAPDDPATIRAKGSGRVLVDTGDLLTELTRADVDGDSVAVDQGDAFYAINHQLGDRGMPRRDPVPEPSESEVDRWAERLATFIVDGSLQ